MTLKYEHTHSIALIGKSLLTFRKADSSKVIKKTEVLQQQSHCVQSSQPIRRVLPWQPGVGAARGRKPAGDWSGQDRKTSKLTMGNYTVMYC